jgi:hypothetical protein
MAVIEVILVNAAVLAISAAAAIGMGRFFLRAVLKDRRSGTTAGQ